ncbi:hypothetical protein [Baekduia sp. Peel2402]|uniref:hypothetical protein n=1 Tax=Baekduia sp. Peel2402 TaxID=3458296 RepID=UPI00403EB108
MTLSSPGVTIRPAFPDDVPALARLAALDSQRLPHGPLLLAEIDGEPWAAIALETTRVIADPFRPTAALVELLRGRAAQLTGCSLRLNATVPATVPSVTYGS